MLLTELTNPRDPKGYVPQHLQRSLRRGSYDDEPETNVELTFYQPGPDGLPDEDAELTSVDIAVEYDVTPDEYEGNHVFSRGGVDVEFEAARPFTWAGKQMNKLVPEMAACCVELAGDGEKPFLAGDKRACWELLDRAVKEQLDLSKVKVPATYGPDSRSAKF